jgi:tyrosyl-tRNA synthetase
VPLVARGTANECSSPFSRSAAPSKEAPSKPKHARDWTDELQTDYERILSVGEECQTEKELKNLLLFKGRGSNTAGFNLYDGFEPSGRMHIAQGVFKAMNVNKCTAGACNSTFVFWVADWFALMNDKMGGDLDKIKTVGHYLIEVWKAAGMDLSHVLFKWASEEITSNAGSYWPTMLDIARRFNVTRIKKCCQIMGRLEGNLTAAQILYPLMQCTDVFFLQADICQLGKDQRKVNMLAREYCDAAKRKHKPIVLSHHMLYGLKAGQEKMSKSDPDSAIFMEDSAADVERKVMAAYCPSKEEEVAETKAEEDDAGKDRLKNPCLDYIEHIIFSPPGASFTAGEVQYTEFSTVRAAFLDGTISEEQLKRGLTVELNRLLEPVRRHFKDDERARDLLVKVQQYKTEAAPVEKTIRRLDLVAAGKVQGGSHLVFAPLPTAQPTLQMAIDLLKQLGKSGPGQPCALLLPDWSAVVCNACNADSKAVSAFYTILTTALKTLDPDTMENVQILLQSEAILTDPSNYWISVINTGRHFKLDKVQGSLKDSEGVGTVIARLMRVADVAGVAPASLALSECEDCELERTLVSEFFAAQLPGVTVPEASLINGTSIRLQPVRESGALKTENDEYFLLDDPKVRAGVQEIAPQAPAQTTLLTLTSSSFCRGDLREQIGQPSYWHFFERLFVV